LNEARINPIIKLPGEGYVIFSQRTAKLGRSALETINVKRMVLEVKSMVVAAAQNIVFENITQDLYDLLNSNIKSLMASVQVKQGIERFNVVCDGTNNTENDVNANRINGRIEFKPTRSVEFIFIDFFVTPSGVSFGS
jgi:phage tail sheath protein FI